MKDVWKWLTDGTWPYFFSQGLILLVCSFSNTSCRAPSWKHTHTVGRCIMGQIINLFTKLTNSSVVPTGIVSVHLLKYCTYGQFLGTCTFPFSATLYSTSEGNIVLFIALQIQIMNIKYNYYYYYLSCSAECKVIPLLPATLYRWTHAIYNIIYINYNIQYYNIDYSEMSHTVIVLLILRCEPVWFVPVWQRPL